jgi:hypothetical protein
MLAPDCPVPVAGVGFPIAPEPGAGGVDVLGWVADGAGGALDGVLPLEPEGGLPVLPPLVCASAGATNAATIASVARMLMIRDAIAVFLLEARTSGYRVALGNCKGVADVSTVPRSADGTSRRRSLGDGKSSGRQGGHGLTAMHGTALAPGGARWRSAEHREVASRDA